MASTPNRSSRGALLEDSYRHVLQLQRKDEPTKFQVKDLPGSSSGLPTRDEYISNMYFLSQSEPIYHDLEESLALTTPAALVTPLPSRANRSSSHVARLNEDVMEHPFAKSCWPGGGGVDAAASSFRRKAYLNLKAPAMRSRRHNVSPMLLGDAGDSSSVMTGASQQELLRKKARSESRTKKRGKENNDRGTARKAKDRILNMPALFLGGSKKDRSTSERKGRDLGRPARVGNKVEDLVPKTQLSRVSEAIVRSCSQSSEDLEMSTAGSTDNMSAGTPPHLAQSKCDRQTTTVPSNAVPNPSQPLPHSDPTDFQDSAMESRNVRFSRKETLTHIIFNDASDRPFDEQDDLSAPSGTASRGAMRAVIEPSPPTSGRSLQSSTSGSSGLKSCLRPARFSPVKGSPDRSHRSDDEGSVVLNASIAKSPPRGVPGFVDHGVELSPIGRTGAVTFNEVVEQVEGAYPDPSLDGASTYSDPTLDVTSEYNWLTLPCRSCLLAKTDDDSMISSVNFINNVGAIVIQAAFRRYLATARVAKLRNSKISSQMETGQRIKRLQIPSHQQVSQKDDRRSPVIWRMSRSPGKSPESPSASRSSEDYFETLEGRMLTLAATKVQAAFRGFWVRDCLSVDHYCARVIQQAFRSFNCRMAYQFDVYRIVMIQSVWRRQIARLRVAHLLGCAVLIQAAVRKYLQRKAFSQRAKKRPVKIRVQKRNVVDGKPSSRRCGIIGSRQTNTGVKDVAATKIQAMWRRAYAETEFLKTLLDVLLVQTAARRWFAIQKVKNMKSIKQRLKRRHRYAVAATKRRNAARFPPKSKPLPPPSLPTLEVSNRHVPAPSLAPSKPTVVTPKGVLSHFSPPVSSECSGSVTGSTSGGSEDDVQHVASRPSSAKAIGTTSTIARDRPSYGVKPPLPSQSKALPVVTPKSFSQGSWRRDGCHPTFSPGGASGVGEDDERTNAEIPSSLDHDEVSPFGIEDSPGGAKALLSLWRERDRKNSLAIGR